MKIMIVDDEVDIQLLFKQKFRKEIKNGLISFQFATSAKEALDILEQQNAESLASGSEGVVLILSDINMPGMSGLELLKLIKDKYLSLKVFMVTAYGDEENHQLAVSYGADDYLNKPIDFVKLKERFIELSVMG